MASEFPFNPNPNPQSPSFMSGISCRESGTLDDLFAYHRRLKLAKFRLENFSNVSAKSFHIRPPLGG